MAETEGGGHRDKAHTQKCVPRLTFDTDRSHLRSHKFDRRYYGTSLPFGAAAYDTPNLAYLSAEQALVDYVSLTASLKANLSAQVRKPPGSWTGPLDRTAR